MQRICPKCTSELTPLARGAFKCGQCAGMFIPSALVPFLQEPGAEPVSGVHDAQGAQCPVDRTLLSRAEIEVGAEQTAIHLERCSSCRGIWFDAGEWSMLASHQLLENLDQIWTAEWRTQQRRQRSEREHERRLRDEFGPELFATLQSVAEKLKGYERRSQALAFLREASED
jgi:Zn-finger nucleic acid-binding protein